MARYAMIKHYRGAPASVNDVPMGRWSPEEVDAHVDFMNAFADRLRETGEFVESAALAPEGVFVRSERSGEPPRVEGRIPESKALVAGWMIIDVASEERACELAAELSAAPGAGGEPVGEWLELRPFYGVPGTTTV